MANTALVQAKIEPLLKMEVEKYLNDFGLDISTAIRIYFKKIVQEEGMPFRIGKTKPSFIPNKAFAQSLDRAMDDIENDRDILHFNDNNDALAYLKGISK